VVRRRQTVHRPDHRIAVPEKGPGGTLVQRARLDGEIEIGLLAVARTRAEKRPRPSRRPGTVHQPDDLLSDPTGRLPSSAVDGECEQRYAVKFVADADPLTCDRGALMSGRKNCANRGGPDALVPTPDERAAHARPRAQALH